MMDEGKRNQDQNFDAAIQVTDTWLDILLAFMQLEYILHHTQLET